jgi:hypothetical protein
MRLWRDRFPGKTIVAGESKGLLEEFARLELCLRTIVISKSVAIFVTVSMFVGGVEFCSVLSCRSLLFSFPTLGSNGLNSTPFTFTSSSYLIYCPSNTVYFYSPNPTRPSLTLPLTQGIDRLERLKGIPLKLIAIEQFLEEQPQWRGKLIFNMIGELGD